MIKKSLKDTNPFDSERLDGLINIQRKIRFHNYQWMRA